MRRSVWLFAWLMVIAGARADEPGLRENSTPLRVEIGHRSYALESFIAHPQQGDRFPVAMIVHGAAESDGELRDINLSTGRQWARTLAARGWLGVSVARRGYATSEGEAFLKIGTCQEPATAAYFDHQAEDVEAALRAIGQRPDADLSRVLLIGKSVGGAVALDVAARGKVKIAAVINVSGGLSSDTPKLAVNPDCDLMLADVVWNFARFGAASHMPTLWLYAENDPWFSPAFVGRMHTAYTAAGGLAQLAMLPALAPDGHLLFHVYEGQQEILPKIDAFLRRVGLPTWNPEFAARLLALLKPEERWVGLQYLREVPGQKALAVADGDPSIAWWSVDPDSIDAAKATATRDCEAHADGTCHLVAVNYSLSVTTSAER